MVEGDESDRSAPKGVAAWIASLKQRPFWVIMAGAVVVIGGMSTLIGFPKQVAETVTWASGVIFGTPSSSPTNPVADELPKLRLGMTREAIAATVAQPLETIEDACASLGCDSAEWPDLEFSYYDLGKLELRTLFDQGDLVFYAFTTVDGTEFEGMEFVGWDLGSLGGVTYEEAYSPLDVQAPDEHMIHLGQQSTAYAETFSSGATSDYTGLYLANAPGGFGGNAFATDAASQLMEESSSSALAAFRAGTIPNTFGEFDTDGGNLGAVPSYLDGNLVSILYLATTF